MKTASKFHKAMIIAILVVSSFGFSVSVWAVPPKDTTGVEFSYIGNFNGKPVFLLNFDNEDQRIHTITITDTDGTVLYFDKIKSKQFSRKFQVDDDGPKNDMLRIELRSGNSEPPQVYQVKYSNRVVTETLISKL
jgi:hypothetical protein